MRVLALLAGAMIVVCAQAAGANYAEFIVDSLADVRPGVALVAAVIPGLIGLARCVPRAGLEAPGRGHRDAAACTRRHGRGCVVPVDLRRVDALRGREYAPAAAVPNLAFALGLILYVLLNLKTGDQRAAAKNESFMHWLGDAFTERVRGNKAQPAPSTGKAEAATASKVIEGFGARWRRAGLKRFRAQ